MELTVWPFPPFLQVLQQLPQRRAPGAGPRPAEHLLRLRVAVPVDDARRVLQHGRRLRAHQLRHDHQGRRSGHRHGHGRRCLQDQRRRRSGRRRRWCARRRCGRHGRGALKRSREHGGSRGVGRFKSDFGCSKCILSTGNTYYLVFYLLMATRYMLARGGMAASPE